MDLLRPEGAFAIALVDILRLGVWLLLLMLVFVPLEKLFSLHTRPTFRKGFGIDLCYYFLNNLLPRTLLVFPVAALAWATRHAVPHQVHETVERLPLVARVVASLVVGEVGFYWGHRWSHEIPFLWRFHAVHHAPEEIDWLVASHVHPVDIIFTRLCGLVPMYVLGLAQPLSGTTLDPVPLLVLLAVTVWGYFVHANVRWRFGWLGWIVATPMFHHWHHTFDGPINRNYAPMLPLVDRVFGTLHLPVREWPARYGTDSVVPPDLAGQLFDVLAPVKTAAGTATID